MMRKIATGLALAALTLVAGCCCKKPTTANCPPRCPVPCCPQPAPCCPQTSASPAPVFVPGQQPLGVQVPVAQPPCR